jgi:hypothetical protein
MKLLVTAFLTTYLGLDGLGSIGILLQKKVKPFKYCLQEGFAKNVNKQKPTY